MFVKLQFVIIFVITCTIVFTMTMMTCASGRQVRSAATGQGQRRSRWGGEEVVKLVWLNGPAEFMKKMTPKTQSQLYNSADFKAQYQIMKREKAA